MSDNFPAFYANFKVFLLRHSNSVLIFYLQIPKGLPYFSVEFGMDGGFAHVIEDETIFPHYFGKVRPGTNFQIDIKYGQSLDCVPIYSFHSTLFAHEKLPSTSVYAVYSSDNSLIKMLHNLSPFKSSSSKNLIF